MLEFARLELDRMNIEADGLAMIRSKDGVTVWRVSSLERSCILKCFAKVEYRREILNYQMLQDLDIPTLKVFGATDRSFLMEDVEQSIWRLGTEEDLRDPKIAVLLSRWYRLLHERGQTYIGLSSLYDESELISRENLSRIQKRTNTADYPVWDLIESRFQDIQSSIRSLPKTVVFNDFYYTNLLVAKDRSAAIMFDYNLMGKGYVYSDLRNVCSSMSKEAGDAFLSAYGDFDKSEIILDRVASVLSALHIACQRERLPAWANEEIAKIENGELDKAVEELLRCGDFS